MSDEDLAVLAQQGSKEALAQLWEQVHNYVATVIRNAYMSFMSEDGFYDAMQEAYIGYLKAVRTFDSRKCSFRRLLALRVKDAVSVMLGFKKTTTWDAKTHTRSNVTIMPINARSMDDTYGEFGNITLANIIPAPPDRYFEDYEAVEHEKYLAQLRAALKPCLEELTDKQRQCIYYYYYNNYGASEIGRMMGIKTPGVYGFIKAALKKLRRHEAELAPFLHSQGVSQ